MRRQLGVILEAGANPFLVTDEDELHALESTARTRDASEHHRQPLIAAHRIDGNPGAGRHARWRSEEHTSELQSLMRISYAVFCLKKKKQPTATYTTAITTARIITTT